jgi:hypothetical protein
VLSLPPIAIPVVIMLAALGFQRGPWWLALAGGVLIAAACIAAQRDLRPQPAGISFADMIPVAGLPSLARGCFVAVLAMASGRLAAQIWSALVFGGGSQPAGIDFL